MKKRVVKRKVSWRYYFYPLIIVLVIIAIGIGAWTLFFNYEKCSDLECFNSNLVSCNKATYISGDRMILEYKIKGTEDGSCKVLVELLQGDLNSRDSRNLEGYSMECFIPKGVIASPESNIANCHGRLKEAWQELVIARLNDYILKNVGKINLDTIDVNLGSS